MRRKPLNEGDASETLKWLPRQSSSATAHPAPSVSALPPVFCIPPGFLVKAFMYMRQNRAEKQANFLWLVCLLIWSRIIQRKVTGKCPKFNFATVKIPKFEPSKGQRVIYQDQSDTCTSKIGNNNDFKFLTRISIWWNVLAWAGL